MGSDRVNKRIILVTIIIIALAVSSVILVLQYDIKTKSDNNEPFVFKVDTTGGTPNSFTIPTNESYNYSIKWTDGNQTETKNNISGDYKIPFDNSGIHEVSINGRYPHFDGNKYHSDVRYMYLDNIYSLDS